MSGEFSITFLGTGSAMPDGERAQTGLLLESSGSDSEGDAENVLLDCGSGVLGNLARTEPGYEGVSTLLLTHHHIDHVADLMALCKARWLAGAEELAVVGPPGTEDLVEGLFAVHEYMQDRLDLSVREVGAGEFEVGGFAVRAIETHHSMDCLAYRFEAPDEPTDSEEDTIEGETDTADMAEADGAADVGAENELPAFTFSGDSEAFPALCELADGGTLAHDCSFPDSVDVSNHPTPTQLGEALAETDAAIDRLYLTHLYPHTRGHHKGMTDSIAARYDGDVRFAQDGLTVGIE
jgi:ribonuclease BN (tRNA processing enzyme)